MPSFNRPIATSIESDIGYDMALNIWYSWAPEFCIINNSLVLSMNTKF